MIDEMHIAERARPLDNLDGNFRASDVLIDRNTGGTPVLRRHAPTSSSPEAAVMWPDYVKRMRRLYPLPEGADSCCCSFSARFRQPGHGDAARAQ